MSKKEYTDALRTYEELVSIAVIFSDASGGIQTSNLGIESTKIYTRLTLSAMTVNSILPENKINRLGLWDFPSIGSLARTFLETCHRYLYLSQQGLSKEESEFRISLSYYHLNSEKYRMYKEFGAEQKVLDGFEENIPKAKEKLMSSPIYASLSKNKADKLRRGNIDMEYSDSEIAEKFSMLGGKFRPIYRLLSNHSHGCPFATFSQSNKRGRGFENEAERSYLILTLMLLNQYLSKTITTQVTLLSLFKVNPEGYRFASKTFEE